LVVSISPVCLVGQTPEIHSPVPTIPTSPQAEAIKKHGEFGVNYFTGIPDISMPLFEIDHHGYKLPVKLSYYPQPFKPGYNYDVFGMGWSLSLNSCVSRSIKFAPDEEKNFTLDDNIMENNYENWKSSMMDYNLQHDLFNVTFPDGSSFNMVIQKKQNGELEYITSDGRSVKVELNGISSFVITDENGIRYTFSGMDTPYIGTQKYSASYVSWLLTRIDLPQAPDEPMILQYDIAIRNQSYNNNEPSLYVSHTFVNVNGDTSPDTYTVKPSSDGSSLAYQMHLLSSIQYGNTSVNLVYSNGSPAPRNTVREIRVFDNGNPVKTISLNLAKHPITYSGAPQNDSIAQLTSLSTVNPQRTQSFEKYDFFYDNMSSFSFNATDHWGNLNIGDSRSIAHIALFSEFDDSQYLGHLWTSSGMTAVLAKTEKDLCPYSKILLSRNTPSDDKEPAGTYEHGILNKIVYPSGGYSEFLFENNMCLSSTDYDGSYIYDKKQRRGMKAGGFRIARITSYTADNVESNTEYFKYGPLRYVQTAENENLVPQPYSANHTDAGEPVVDPNIFSYASFASSPYIPSPINYMLAGLSPYGKYEAFYDPFHNTNGHDGNYGYTNYKWECSFSSSNFRAILDGRPAVVYPEVTVYHGKTGEYNVPALQDLIGKTVYKYDVYEPSAYDTAFFESPQYYGNRQNTLYYEPLGCRYNTLLEKREYAYTGDGFLLKSREQNRWVYNFQSVTDYIYTKSYPDGWTPNIYSTSVGDFFAWHANNIGTKMLTDKETTLYENNGAQINSYESYGYHVRDQLGYKLFLNSNGDALETYWTYPDEIKTSIPPVIGKMVEKNIIMPAVETRTVMHGNTVKQEKMDYAEFPAGADSIIMPSRFYKMEFNPAGTQYALQDEVLSYTVHGNPVEFVGKDGIHNVAIWGYDDRYMVAMVKDATYSDVSGALSQLGIANSQGRLTSVETLDPSAAAQVIQRLPSSAQVTTYTYRPLVGMLTATAPNGVTTYYEYDTFNRLKRTYIKENNVEKTVQSYDYHYQGQ
jgi:hypothetical protein